MSIVCLFSRFTDTYPITSQDDKVVFSRDMPLSDFRDRDQSILFDTIVSERSWHSQTRCFCVWLPYTMDSWLIFHTENPPIASDNSLLLLYYFHTKTNTRIKIQERTRIIFISFSRSSKGKVQEGLRELTRQIRFEIKGELNSNHATFIRTRG